MRSGSFISYSGLNSNNKQADRVLTNATETIPELIAILDCSLHDRTYCDLIWLLFGPLQGLATLAQVDMVPGCVA